ncbi:MAG: Asp-tRNA(Asn)/Glu-tRNA(Gln) amidotransferase subunit GatA [Candidatus Pacebacteria bacterium]|nr:Asp-tRNA(Asn)/Glu-tRNA(Gln) amidotransferase subunit GatA [Candidatus Paceibacterota bacterium]
MIKDIQNKLKNKEITCTDLAQSYLNKIKDNQDLNCFISLSENVLNEAKKIDEKIQKNEELKPLDGIFIAVKDNILVKGMYCTAASKMLEDYIAAYDATVINKLKDAGAIIIGKTNMDEFAMGSSNETSAFGKVLNPINKECVPGGSSGGSACAINKELSTIALGSDTAGSIRQPACFCGVVGFKPSYGSVSRYGLISMSSSLDQIGPITSSVEDSEIIFNIIKGIDQNDSTTSEVKDLNLKNKITIGLPKEYFQDLDDDVKEFMDQAITELKNQGFDLKEISLPHTKYALPCYDIIMPAEVSSNLSRYDNIRYGTHFDKLTKDISINDLDDVYLKIRGEKLGKEVKRRILLGMFILSAGYYDAYYTKAQKVRQILINEFENIFKDVDFILTPTTPTKAFRFNEKQDPVKMYQSDILTVSANLTGLPAISLPVHTSDLPVGIQIIGQRFEDLNLLSIAKQIEKICTTSN